MSWIIKKNVSWRQFVFICDISVRLAIIVLQSFSLPPKQTKALLHSAQVHRVYPFAQAITE
jgi:hypothetical protein